MSRVFILLLLCLWAAWPAGAERRVQDDPELSRAFRAWCAADGLAYTALVSIGDVQSKTPDTAGAKMQSYGSRKDSVQYTTGAVFTYLFCRQGTFRAFPDRKVVVYRTFSTDSAWQTACREKFALNNEQALDSVLLRGATIKERKKVKGRLQYTLSYPPESLMKEMTVTLNLRADFVEDLRYEAGQAAAPGTLAVRPVRQRYRVYDYTHAPPPALVQMLKGVGSNLRQYLEQAYPGYHLQEQTLR